MAETLEVIRDTLIRIEEKVDGLPNSIRLAATQVIVINGLSDIDVNLGLIMAGEFRAGNQNAPGQGFSGMRMGYPAFTYAGDLWNLVGVENDVMQVGISASDGKFYAGGGKVRIDASGIYIDADATSYSSTSAITFENPYFIGEQLSIYATSSVGHQSIQIGSYADMGGLSTDCSVVLFAGAASTNNEYISLETWHSSMSQTKLILASDGTAQGITFYVGGSLPDDRRLSVGATLFVINPAGVNVDTQIMGDTDVNCLVVDAGTDVVSIGAAAVAMDTHYGKLQITKAGAYPPLNTFSDTSGYGPRFVNSAASGTGSGAITTWRASITPTTVDHRLSILHFQAITTGTTYTSGVQIAAFAAETWDATHAGSYLKFLVTPLASVTATEVIRLQADQNVLFAKNAKFTVSPGADHLSSGKVLAFTNHDAVNFGDACYLNSDGEMALADADAIATSSAVGMALSTLSAHSSGDFLMFGIARDDTWAWTVGGLIYLSTTGTTGNTLTQTAPSGTDDVIQILGVATHADRMIFMPNLVQVEHT